MNRDFHMNTVKPAQAIRAALLMLMIAAAGVAPGCAQQIPTLFSPMQADGWSAQPIAVNSRFTPDAVLDPVSGTPVGDEGFYLYVLTSANYWDYRDTQSFVVSFIKHPSGHSWMILESPRDRLECGHTGNFGLMQPRYHDGVIQRIRDDDPNPIAYIWQTMSDGQFEMGNPGREPTFVWRIPITRDAHERIYDYTMNRKYDRFSLSTYNCGEMVTQAAALAGVNLTSLVRITFPAEGKIKGHTLRVWTDPKYSAFEIRSIDVLEVDLRQLARMGIGSDATADYRKTKPYQPLVRLDHPSDVGPSLVSEQARR